eukprot:1208536-Rhodomonas_salina.2
MRDKIAEDEDDMEKEAELSDLDNLKAKDRGRARIAGRDATLRTTLRPGRREVARGRRLRRAHRHVQEVRERGMPRNPKDRGVSLAPFCPFSSHLPSSRIVRPLATCSTFSAPVHP